MDSVFSSLADPTRRDILRRVTRSELTVGEISADYDMSMAAVSKHIKMLERAMLVIKRRRGKEQLVSARTNALAEAREYLEWYRQFMDGQLDSLEEFLNKEV